MKYPVVIPYIKSPDSGKELRYTLRSLKNITNWNGEVAIVGDKEAWFNDIIHIPCKKRSYSPYEDVANKVMAVLQDDRIPDNYIWTSDDIYVTAKTEVKPLHGGLIPDQVGKGYHNRAKLATKKWLQDKGIKNPLNYDIHVPMIINKQKRLEVHNLVKGSFRGTALFARTIYGNLYIEESEYYQDNKTKTPNLKSGLYISTAYYTDELDKLFPKPSKYESSLTTLYDHTETQWARRYEKLKRNNGARTYTQDIVKYQVPLWKKHARTETLTVSATNYLSSIPKVKLSELNVQYLHTYKYDYPLEIINKINTPRTLYVTAYKDLLKHTDKAVFIPMTIDAEKITPHKKRKKYSKRVIWFGNVLGHRVPMFDVVQKALKKNGLELDCISHNKFNGQTMTQTEMWEKISEYKYGVGCGRSALEMSALGVKVMYVSKYFGGIVTNDKEWQTKIDGNFASKHCTYSKDIDKCIRDWDKSLVRTMDIKEHLPEIEKTIKKANENFIKS
jgi:hypothetical protein